jgi:hypothetical protein
MIQRESSTYDSGLCMKHGGRRVGRAHIIAAQPVEPPPLRPGIRVVEMGTSHPGSSCDTVRTIPVSLPKEPWL